MDSAIQEIRASMSLLEAWRILGLPGTPRIGDLHSPFHEDKRPSFTIYQAKGYLRFHDHATGAGGDCIDLWALSKGISVKEAITEILAYRPDYNNPLKAPNRPPEASLPQEGILWPENLTEPSEADARALGALRSLSPEAFFLAGQLGTLLMGDKRGQRLWMTTDKKMRSAAMRRLDGKNLDLINKKSASPKNAKRDWPVGLLTTNPDLDQLPNVLLVEGEADYYAALQIALESEINFRVCAMLGASSHIALEAKEHFRGARILIIPHNDRSLAGEKAAGRWAAQLHALGAKEVLIQPLPIMVNDLNDFLTQRPLTGPQLLKGFHDGTTQGARK